MGAEATMNQVAKGATAAVSEWLPAPETKGFGDDSPATQCVTLWNGSPATPVETASPRTGVAASPRDPAASTMFLYVGTF